MQVGQFAIDLVDSLLLVQADCNNNNAAIVQEALPIMLRQLVQTVSRNFISDVLNPHHKCLNKFLTDVEIKQIEVNQKEIV